VKASQEAEIAVLELMSAMVQKKLPHVPALLQSTLLPISKPCGGIRPIAIGEVWYRLAGLCALATCKDVGQSLAPLQLAVGVPGGAQIVGHALAAGIAAEPDCVTLQLDVRNAFNTLSRQRMLKAVAQRSPSLLPFATWSYATLKPLRLRGSAATIASTRGVRQGDPCGPLFFALALQGPLEELWELDRARPLAYADDIFLQGTQGGVEAAFPVVCDVLEPLGLQVTLPKCAAYSAAEANGAAVSEALGIQHAVGGITATGTPVGEAAFVATQAQECASKACHLMNTLDALPLPAQNRWLLLQGSLQLRVAHLPRVGEWAAVGTAVMVAEDRALQSTGAILGRETGAFISLRRTRNKAKVIQPLRLLPYMV
jgi:hypothetical protein